MTKIAGLGNARSDVTNWAKCGHKSMLFCRAWGGCKCVVCPHPKTLEKRKREKDARLIASAPKMLEALENLENDDGSIPDHAWKLVKDAIECAVGKSNSN